MKPLYMFKFIAQLLLSLTPSSLLQGFEASIFSPALFTVICLLLLSAGVYFLWRWTRAERSVRVREEVLRALLTNVDDAVITTDARGCISRMNIYAEQLSGWEYALARGKPLLDVLPLVDVLSAEPLVDPLSSVLAGAERVRLNAHILHSRKDATEYQISGVAAPICDTTANVVGAILAFRAVNALPDSQNERASARGEFNIPFESSEYGILLLDPQNGYLDCNVVALKMFGIPSKEEFCLLDPTELSPEYQSPGELSVDRFGKEMDKVLKEGIGCFEWRHKTVAGSEFWVSVQATRVELGGRVLLQCMLRDITVHKQVVERARQSEERFNLAMVGANVGIWDWNPAASFAYFDSRYYTMAGYAVDEFPPTFDAWKKRVHPEDIASTLFNLEQHLAGNLADYDVEFRFKRKDGDYMWILSRGWVVARDDQGAPVRFVGTHSDITRLKQAEERLNKIFDNTQDAILLHDLQGKILDVNAKACEIYALSKEQLCAVSIKDLSSSNMPMDVLAGYWDRALKGEKLLFEWEGQRALNGPVFYAEVSLQRIGFSDKDIILANVRDITARKHAAEELANRERFLDRIIEQSPFATWISDAQGVLQRSNSALKKLLNLNDVQLIGIYNVLQDPLVERQGLMPAVRSVYEDGQTVNFMIDWAGDDIATWNLGGSNRVYVDATLFPIHDSAGELTNVVCHWINITERKQAEEELQHLRNYLSNIIDSMPSVLVGVDAAGQVTQWNQSAQQATGVTANAALGRALVDVFPQMSVQMEKILASIRTRETQHELKRARSVADGVRYEDVTIYPLTSNGVEGAVIRIDDVTEKVHMEDIMIQSEKMLSVGGLAAGMAHEINNPLAGMMQTANVMANRLSEDIPANLKAAEAAGASMEAIRAFMAARGIPRMLASIHESGMRVARIVDNMLSFARRSDEPLEFHDIVELLDKTLELAATDYDLKRHYDFKMVKIVREYQSPLPLVLCDAVSMQQVFLNVLRNGAEAMQEVGVESPTFVLRTHYEKVRGMVSVEITDNGPGIEEEVRKRVFEPFFTTKPVGLGTGLGLSVSYFIVTENHSGEMDVISEHGKGATFIIRLPLER